MKKRKQTNKYHELTVPIWNIKMVLYVSNTEPTKHILDIMNKYRVHLNTKQEVLADKLEDSAAGACWFCPKQAIVFMWLPEYKIVPSVLQHETVHAVDFIMQYIGANTELEARAYTFNFIYDSIRKFCKDKENVLHSKK